MEKLNEVSLGELISFDKGISAILARLFAENGLAGDILDENIFSVIFLQQNIQDEIQNRIPEHILDFGFENSENKNSK